MAFARHVFGGDANAAPDHNAVASAVFSSPPISTVGLTEAQAVEQFGDVDIYSSSFRWALGGAGLGSAPRTHTYAYHVHVAVIWWRCGSLCWQ